MSTLGCREFLRKGYASKKDVLKKIGTKCIFCLGWMKMEYRIWHKTYWDQTMQREISKNKPNEQEQLYSRQ